MNSDGYSGTQAIGRAVALLKAFAPDGALLTPADLSRRTGINRSTVYRLLSALEREGLVIADEAGRYRLGPELVILGSLALRQIDLRATALPHLHALAEQSRETVDLEVLHGAKVLIIEEVSGDHLLSAASNVGTLYPAHCTATGKVLLAYLAPDQLDALLAGKLSCCGPRSLTNRAALLAELEQVRECGYATAYEELEAHLHAVGAAVFDHRGVAVAGVSLSGPAVRLPREREGEISMLVRETCRAISRALGYR